ncbi:MAG: MFS transporter [Anaerolineae bacterium]
MTDQRTSTRLLFISFSGFVIVGLSMGVLNLAWTYIQDTLGLTLDALGVLLTAFMVGRLFSSFAGGQLTNHLGVGRFLLMGHLIMGAGLLGHVLAPTWPVLVLAGGILGLGAGVLIVGLNTYVAAHYSAGRLNWLNACFGLGQTLGPLLVTLLAVKLGRSWRWSYGSVLVLQGVSFVFLLLTLPQWRLRDENAPVTSHVSMRETLRRPYVWLSMALVFVYGGAEVGGGQLSSSLFTDGRGIDVQTTGLWISIYWASFTVGRILMGALVDRISNAALLRLSMLGAILGAGLIWWNPFTLGGFLGLALMGLSFATIFPTVAARTPDRLGLAHAANAMGLQIGASGLGSAFLPGLGALLAERLSLEIIGPFLLILNVAVFLLHELSIRSTRDPGLSDNQATRLNQEGI